MKRKAVGCCALVFFFISVLLLGFSFSTLGPLEAGVLRNTLTSQIDEETVYLQGRHFTGLMSSFVRYPTTLQTIYFGAGEGADAGILNAATNGGLKMGLEISFQYRLQVENLVPLYRRYETNYKSKFITIAESKLKEMVGGEFIPEDYYTQRERVAEVLQAALNARFREDFGTVEFFQILEVQPPVQTDARIIATLVAGEQILLKQFEQAATLKREDIKVVLSTKQQQARIAQAEARSTAKVVVAEAEAKAITIKADATANSYKVYKDAFNLTNAELLRLMFLEQVRTLGADSELSVNVDSALFTF
jgi:regulator of protease activity HflC (stomatin/prohibitin superfamily)